MAQARDSRSDNEPLSQEQLAFYKARIESGYYLSSAVRQHVARRVADELFTRDSFDRPS